MGNLNIDDIRERCRDGAIRWSAHSASRMLQRGITREEYCNFASIGRHQGCCNGYI